MLKVTDIPAGGLEKLNKTEAITGHVIVTGRILLGIGDEENATDVLNIERRKTVGNSLGFESIITKEHTLELCVVDFDASLAEIGDVEKFVAVDFAGGCTFIDGTIR